MIFSRVWGENSGNKIETTTLFFHFGEEDDIYDQVRGNVQKAVEIRDG